MSRAKWLFPLLLVLYEISQYLSNDMYLPAMPQMMRDLGLSGAEVQLTVTMWFLGSAIAPLAMGALADRFGRRKTLLIGGVIFIAATLLCAWVDHTETLYLARLLQGAMVASMMVAGYAAIHECYGHKDAIKILAVLGGISVLAPAAGPLVGALVLLVTDWRWIFYLIAIYAGIMLVFLYCYMPETLTSQIRQSLNPLTIARNYWRVLMSRHFILLMTAMASIFVGFISWISAGPLLVIESMGYSELTFGWIQGFVFGGFILGSHVVNKLMETHDARRLVSGGMIISLLSGLLGLLGAYFYPQQLFLFVAAVIVYSFGTALSYAPLNRLIIETSNLPMGIRVALFTAGLMGSGALGSVLASLTYNGSSLSIAIIIAAGIVFASILQIIYTISQK